MAMATATRNRKQAHRGLREDAARTGTLRVDREKKTVYGVKVCGLQSKNGRQYPAEVLRSALHLYEGASVYKRHSSGSRDPDELLGQIVRPELRADGVYGDFEYLIDDATTQRILEAAERMPQQLGFSQDADVDGEFREGVLVITGIHKINSVDLVTNPATTNGLNEEVTVKTFREFLQARKDNNKTAALWLTEDDMPLEMPAPDAANPVVGDYKQDLLAAIGKLLDSEDPADVDLSKKIMALLTKKAAPAPDASGDATEDDALADEKKSDDKKDDDKMQEEVKRLKSELAVRRLCESIGFFPSDVQVKALAALDGDERKELAETFRPSGLNGRARSAPPRHVTESADLPKSPDEARKRWVLN